MAGRLSAASQPMTSAAGRLNERLAAVAWPAALRTLPWLDMGISMLLLVAAASLHALVPGGRPIPGGVPTGADPGNWLALAREFWGHPVMSLDSWYPPIFPTLLGGLLFITTPIQALVAAGLVAQWSLLTGCYWTARELGRLRATAVALLAGTAGYQLEAYAWGAFPQLLATGVALVVLWMTVRLIDRPHHGWIVLTALGAVAVVASHKLVAALLVLAVPMAALHALWLRRSAEDTWAWKKAGPALVVLATLAIAGAAEWYGGSRVGYQPVLNPLSLSRPAVLYATVWEAAIPWAVVAAIGVWAISYRAWPGPLGPIASSGSAWALVGVGFFLVTGEQRSLLLAQLGLIMLMVAAFARWRLLIAQREPRPRFAPAILTVAAWAMIGSISLSGLTSFSASAEWYQFIDHAELRVLEQLKQASRPGDIVVAARGLKGSPTGWWVEGYARRPTYSSHDLRYLSFPEERSQAALANRIFQENLSRIELISLLEAIGARYLVVDRRGPDGGWLARSEYYGLTVAFDSPSLVVLRVPGLGIEADRSSAEY